MASAFRDAWRETKDFRKQARDAVFTAEYGPNWRRKVAVGGAVSAAKIAVPIAAGVALYKNRKKIANAIRGIRNGMRSGRGASNAAQV